MNVGLGVILALATGIGLLYGEKGYAAAIGTGGAGVALWLWYDSMICKEMQVTNYISETYSF